MQTYALLTILVSLLATTVLGQEECNAVLQKGIYDTYSINTTNSTFSNFVSEFCSDYQTYQEACATSSNSNSVNVGGFFEGLGASFGLSNFDSASSEQISALGSILCTASSNTQSSQSTLNEVSEFIDPNIIAAYQACLSEYSTGLHVTSDTSDDETQINIQLSYVAPPGTPAQTTISDIVILPQGSWTCYGPLWNLAQNSSDGILGTDTVAMTCGRNVSSTPFTYQSQSYYALSSSITIFATSGTVVKNFEPIYAITNQTETETGLVTQQIKIQPKNLFLSGPAIGPAISPLITTDVSDDCKTISFNTSFLTPPEVNLTSSPPNLNTSVSNVTTSDFAACWPGYLSESYTLNFTINWTATGLVEVN